MGKVIDFLNPFKAKKSQAEIVGDFLNKKSISNDCDFCGSKNTTFKTPTLDISQGNIMDSDIKENMVVTFVMLRCDDCYNTKFFNIDINKLDKLK